MRTCYTVIIGNYDDLKQPFIISKDWRYVCFTDQDFDLPDDNVWEIVKVKQSGLGQAKTARRIKILFHEYIESDESLFIDGTFFINCDLNRWWKRFTAPFTTIAHPFDRCVYVELQACLNGGRGNRGQLTRQKRFLMSQNVPTENGLIASGILMRQNTPEVREFCELWWANVLRYSERDQIAFAYANFIRPNSHVSIQWNYTQEKEFIHVPHIHKRWMSNQVDELIKTYGSNKTD